MDRTGRTIAALALSVAAVVLVGCAQGPAPSPGPSIPPGITAPPPTPVGEPEPEPAPEPESSLSAEIAGVDTSGWTQVAVPSGAATFRIPPDWSTAEQADGLAVLRADGERQLALVEGASRGDGRCVDGAGTAVSWRTLPLDRQPVQVPGASGEIAFGAVALQLGGQWIVSVGLLPNAEAQSPRCPIANVVDTSEGAISFASEVVPTGSGPGAPWAVGSLEAAQGYVGTEEFATIRAILMSLELLPQG